MKNRKNIFKKVIFFIALFLVWFFNLNAISYAEKDVISEAIIKRDINKGTFYWIAHNLLKESLNLEEHYNVNWEINKVSAKKMLRIAENGRNYLKDNLENDRLLKHFRIALRKWMNEPRNKNVYKDIFNYMNSYINDSDVYRITWEIIANPDGGDSPLKVTLRTAPVDWSGTKIPKSYMSWYIVENSKKVRIGSGPTVKYTLNWEWKIPVFLEVRSSHKNSKWYNDVLPLVVRKDIKVGAKAANVTFTVNAQSTKLKTRIKFTPEEAKYWLVFDPTSTYPRNWATIVKTEWDFWNGEKRIYEWKPRIEIVNYWIWNATYPASLTIYTNENKKAVKKVDIYIHKPIAVIEWGAEEWYILDEFTFHAKKNKWAKKLSYSWKMVEIESDETLWAWEEENFTYQFVKKWRYKLLLEVTDLANRKDYETKDIVIYSRPPVAKFTTNFKKPNFPNLVFLDATDSYDPDYEDQATLEYIWTIDWEKVELEEKNENTSLWYYKFDTIWDHKILLTVIDSDWMSDEFSRNVNIKSVLWVDFEANPWVSLVWKKIIFTAQSEKARFFKWDFGDGTKKSWSNSRLSHVYKKSWDYKVILTVEDRVWNSTKMTKKVYIWEKWKPKAVIDILNQRWEIPIVEEEACDGEEAFIIDRKSSFKFSWSRSIDITWKEWNLNYFWKVWNDALIKSNNVKSNFSKKFEILGCFPVKLTVTSKINKRLSKSIIWVKVINLPPKIKGLTVKKLPKPEDPMIVQVTAIGARDPDGAIQSYMWYYYTENNPEPQQYKLTTWPTAKFVINKIQWKYFFVVVMKDSNGAKTDSSEFLRDSEYTLEVVSDESNINTPIINFRVDSNNVSIWDKVHFSVMARNIIGKDLTKKSRYTWDFNWDWKWDKWPDSSNIVDYIYKESGDNMLTKVKVTYKWASNTRILKMNVHNPLVANFDYISVWNKFILVDQSTGKIDRIKWDMWNGKLVKANSYNIFTYTDKKKEHEVTLTVAEWSKEKKITKKVEENFANKIKFRKKGLHVITFPKAEDDIVTLTENDRGKRVYIYLWESRRHGTEFSKYTIDYDITEDTNADSKPDNDIDNINDRSYEKWTPVAITLNHAREQTIKISLIWTNWEVYESKEIKIVKEYIEEEDKVLEKLDTLEFSSLTLEEKNKIEEIKWYIRALPKKNVLEAVNYMESLEQNWWDTSERVNIISDFSWYSSTIVDEKWKKVMEAEAIENILDWLLSNAIWWQIDPERQELFEAIKKIISSKQIEKYDEVIEALEYMRDHPNDIEWNKQKAVFIYNDNIKLNEAIWIEDKKLVNHYLRLLIWDIEPVTGSWTVEEQTEPADESGPWFFSNLFGSLSWGWMLVWLAYILWWLVWILFLWFLIFLIMHKINNSKRSDKIWFQDYIIEKTRWWNKGDYEEVADEEVDDIFADLDDETNIVDTKQEKVKIKQEKNIRDPLALNNEIEKKVKTKNEEVPDWLSWTTETKEEKKQEVKKEEPKREEPKKEETKKETKEEDVPDWLSWVDLEETKEEKVEKKPEIKKEEPKKEEVKKEKKGETKEEVPDWLSWVDLEEKIEESKKEEIKKEKPKKVEEKEETKEEEVPDWLSWVDLEEKKEEKIEKKQEVKKEEPKKEEVKEIKKDIPKKEETKKTPVKKTVTKKRKQEKKVDKNLDFSDDDLEKMTDIESWDVPDWLKQEAKTEKKPKKKEEAKVRVTKKETPKKAEVVKKETKVDTKKEDKKTDDWIPDWLQEEATKKVDTKPEKKKTWDSENDLWWDGMDIPDWLQDEAKKKK